MNYTTITNRATKTGQQTKYFLTLVSLDKAYVNYCGPLTRPG